MDLLLLSTVVKLLLLSSGGLLSGGDLYGRLLITESHPWDEERLLHVHVFVTEVGPGQRRCKGEVLKAR